MKFLKQKVLVLITIPIIGLIILCLLINSFHLKDKKECQNSYAQFFKKQERSLIEQVLANSCKNFYINCQASFDSRKAELEQNLNILNEIIRKEGGIYLDKNKSEIQAINESSLIEQNIQLYSAKIGDSILKQEFFAKLLKENFLFKKNDLEFSVLQKMNDFGDEIRIVTTLSKSFYYKSNNFISHKNKNSEDEKKEQEIKDSTEIIFEKTFIDNQCYLAAYKPIFAKNGDYFGRLEILVSELNYSKSIKEFISRLEIGKTGTISVLRGKGEQSGKYIFSNVASNVNKNILHSKNKDGKLFFIDLLKEVTQYKKLHENIIKVFNKNFQWKNNNNFLKNEFWAISYFEQFDWVIVTTVDSDDLIFYSENNIQKSSHINFLLFIWMIFILIVVLSLAIAYFFGKKLTYQVNICTKALQDAQNGNMLTNDVIISIKSRDEFENLAMACQNFIKNIHDKLSMHEQQAREMREFAESVTTKLNTISEFAPALQDSVASIWYDNSISKDLDEMQNAFRKLENNSKVVISNHENLSNNINKNVLENKEFIDINKQSHNNIDEYMKLIKELCDYVSKVIKIVNLIQKTSEESSLLALNASIESSNTDETSKGFVVVANSVKDLSKKSGEFADEIEKYMLKIKFISEKIGNFTQENFSVMNRMINSIDDTQNKMKEQLSFAKTFEEEFISWKNDSVKFLEFNTNMRRNIQKLLSEFGNIKLEIDKQAQRSLANKGISNDFSILINKQNHNFVKL